ncbi:hypothetical protein AB0N89_12305 [Amycolatopsis sp. NPDC089917]|uniref:hypothetical protein n=1 Tax=Amycolatopsis sp. NPDC089917 TaxID=3155187 RepID=UPI003412152C
MDEFEQRLRQQYAAVAVPAIGAGESERMARSVLAAHARRWRRGAIAAVIAAIAVLGGGVVAVESLYALSRGQIQNATSVTQWPARGSLAGDTALAERAQQLWQRVTPPTVDSGSAVTVLYAGPPPPGDTDMGIVVVLRGRDHAGRILLAFVTGTDPQHLRMRAQLHVPAGVPPAPAYGFVDGLASPQSSRPTLALALTAPGVSAAAFTSSATDPGRSSTTNRSPDGLITDRLPPPVRAYNTRVVATTADGEISGQLTGAGGDPTLTPVTLTGGGTRLHTTPDTAVAEDDIVVTPEGFVGLVRRIDDTGTGTRDVLVDTDPTRLTPVVTETTPDLPGGTSVFLSPTATSIVVSAGGFLLAEGTRILLPGFSRPTKGTITIDIGTVRAGPGGSRLLRRSVDPADGPAILIHP